MNVICRLAKDALLMFCDPRELWVRSSVNSSKMDLTSVCNVNCLCAEVPYEPVCSHDQLQYYSPCHAGCLNQYEREATSTTV